MNPVLWCGLLRQAMLRCRLTLLTALGRRALLGLGGAWLCACLAGGVVVLFPGAAEAAIVKVQSASFPAQGAGTSTSVQFASPPTVGNTIVVFVWSWGGNAVTGNAITVTDSQGNTYSSLPQVSTSGSGIPGYQDAAILSTIVTSTSSTLTLTATTARTGAGTPYNGLSEVGAVAVEYSGLAGMDLNNTAKGTSATASISLGGNTTYKNEMVAAIVSILWPAVNFSSITASGTGTWTQEGVYTNNANFAAGQMSDQTFTTIANPSITWTPGSNTFQSWVAAIVAFNPIINCTSVQNGNWSSPSTWTNCNLGVPVAGYTATIASGTTVNLDVSTPVLTSVTVNAGGTLTATAANTLNVGRAAGASIVNNGTINFGNVGNIALGNNLSLSGSGSWTINSISAGSYTLDASAMPSTSNIAVNGNFSSSNTFKSGNGTWSFTGSGAQSITGSMTFANLAVNNTGSGVTLAGSASNVTVSNKLTLTNGILATGSNTLIYTPYCTTAIAVANGYVMGNLSLNFPTGSPTCTFPVGDNVGYAPITTGFANVTTAGTLIGTTLTDTGYVQEVSAGFNTQASVARSWTLTPGTVRFSGTYTSTLQWAFPADLETLAVTSTFFAKYLTSGVWTTPTVGVPSDTTIAVSGLTAAAFGTFVVGATTPTPGPTPSASFNVVDSYYTTNGYNAAATHDIYTKLAGTPFSVAVVALSSTGAQLTDYVAPNQSKTVRLDLIDDSSGAACNASRAACAACAKPVVATVSAVAIAAADTGYHNNVPYTIGNAYARLIARVTDTTSTPTVYGCSTGAFTIRPPSFTVTATTSGGSAMTGASSGPTGLPVVKAGSNFTIAAASGTVNYSGTPSVDPLKISDYLGSPTAISTLFSGAFNAAVATSGRASGTFTYGEVGYFNLAANAVIDNTYAASSGNISNGDCVANSTSNTLSAGLYGCSIGSAATSWGRFVPDHFALSGSASLTNRADLTCAPASSFTYLGEDFKTTFTLSAQNASNATTLNYANFATAGNYAKLPLAWSNLGLAAGAGTLAQGSTTMPTASWGAAGSSVAGQAAIVAYSQLTRSTSTPSAPLNTVAISAVPVDSDGVTGTLALGNSNFYFGRLQLTSVAGRTGATLQVPLQAFYWSGSSWVKNGYDSCTTVPAASVALSNYVSSGGSGSWTTSAAGVTLANGLGNIVLSAPAPAGSTGSVSLALDLGTTSTDNSCLTSHPASTGAALAYLRGQNCSSTYTADPSAQATFGIYTPEYIKTIHVRELY